MSFSKFGTLISLGGRQTQEQRTQRNVTNVPGEKRTENGLRSGNDLNAHEQMSGKMKVLIQVSAVDSREERHGRILRRRAEGKEQTQEVTLPSELLSTQGLVIGAQPPPPPRVGYN